MASKATAKADKKPFDYIGSHLRPLTALHPNEQEFRFTVIRPDFSESRVRIDGLVENCEWRDEGTEDNLNTIPMLRGQMSLRKAHPEQLGAKLSIRHGHRIRCEVRWGGMWRHYWEMRIESPRVGVGDGAWTFELADDLLLATKSEGTFRYPKAKKGRKKRGWLYHEIVRDVCRKYRIPLGSVVKGTKRITLSESKISPLEAIRLALEQEAKWTGRRYVIRWLYSEERKRYALHILPMRRNPLLYLFKDQIREAGVVHGRRAEIVTAALGQGTQRKGRGKKKKIKKLKSVRYVSPLGVKRYGYIAREIEVPGTVESRAQLRARLKREIARRMRPVRQIESFSHPGIAFVRRGDAVRVSIPQEGLAGKQGVLFVTSAIHSLSAGDYTMSLTLSFTDMLDPDTLKKEREKALRAQKRAKKGKR